MFQVFDLKLFFQNYLYQRNLKNGKSRNTTVTDRPHERGVQPGRRPAALKSLGGPWTSKFKIEMGNYAQNFYCYNFIYTVLCSLIGWSCCFSSYTMYHHFFWCAPGQILIAAVLLLAQCTKSCLSCRNSRKYVSDVT